MQTGAELRHIAFAVVFFFFNSGIDSNDTRNYIKNTDDFFFCWNGGALRIFHKTIESYRHSFDDS